MLAYGFWNVRRKGNWYRVQRHNDGITDPSSSYIHMMSKEYQHCDISRFKTAIPFPLPLRQGQNYVYTLDTEVAHLTVSLWDYRSADETEFKLAMRRLSHDSRNNPSPLNDETLLQHANDPLLEIPSEEDLHVAAEGEHWDITIEQPSLLAELQYRMFMDFVYQWRFFIDEHTAWRYCSPTLVRRLCIALLSIAAWDLEISTQADIAKLPLDAESYPSWDSPPTDIYWFHRSLVVLCEELKTSLSISTAVSKVREFIGHRKGRDKQANCILISLTDIAFVQISAEGTKCSTVFPLITNTSATEFSAGFAILTHFLTSPHTREGEINLAERETSNIAVPPEVLGLILNAVEPHDIISFAQASFKVEDWYYSSLPQLTNIFINHLDVSIPCCGRASNNEGWYCSNCYIWLHFECVDPSARTLQGGCLIPGVLGRFKLERFTGKDITPKREDGCRVLIGGQEKVLQLRVSATAILKPELESAARDLSSTPANQVDYVVLFGGQWSGLAYGLDDVGSEART